MPLTPQERAEKILTKCLAIRPEFIPPNIKAEIAAQIEEAEQEAYSTSWYWDGYRKGFSAAKEKAKGIANSMIQDSDVSPTTWYYSGDVGKRISEMKVEER